MKYGDDIYNVKVQKLPCSQPCATQDLRIILTSVMASNQVQLNHIAIWLFLNHLQPKSFKTGHRYSSVYNKIIKDMLQR